jgi:hypothetical protein
MCSPIRITLGNFHAIGFPRFEPVRLPPTVANASNPSQDRYGGLAIDLALTLGRAFVWLRPVRWPTRLHVNPMMNTMSSGVRTNSLLGGWALRCALVSGDKDLLKLASLAVDYTRTHVDSDGYLGPTFAKQPQGHSNTRWPLAVFFRALTTYGDASGDSRFAQVMARHYLSDKSRIAYGGPSRNVANVESMLWAYSRTGDRRMLSLATEAWEEFPYSVPSGDHDSGDLHPDRVFSNAPIDAHGVTYAEKSKLPTILFMYTGKTEYLRYAVAAQERVFSHHMLIDGIPKLIAEPLR